ncbi:MULTISPECIES: MinD/ParA family protein [unclassified Clostridium]|uniref:MinD/ParA family protein n=1 Tax=unclassified Clostridium TaxID=2614128 RepID=UPI0032171514
MLDQASRLRQMVFEKQDTMEEGNNNTKIFTITSGKGGVGKSNMVINLAISLKKLGKKVLVLDADLGMGNVDVLIGTIPRYTIFDIILNNKSVHEVVINGPLGIKILCGGTGLSRLDDLNRSQREVLINKLGEIKDFDYILIDTGAGINRTVMAFIECSHEVFIVTTPEPTALTDAYSLLKTICNHNVKNRAKIIVNKVLSKEEGNDTFNRLNSSANRFLGANLVHLGNIAEDKKLVQAVRMQRPVVLSFPKSEVSENIESIAKGLEGISYNKGNSIQGIFKKMLNIFS